MTVYADGVFLLNSFINYLLLLACDRLYGGAARRKRLILAAVLGGAYAVLALCKPLGFLQTFGMKAILFFLMIACAFGLHKSSIRLGGLFFALSAAFAGIVLLCTRLFSNGLFLIGGSAYYPVSFFGLMLICSILYLLVRFVFFRFFQHTGSDVLAMRLCLGEKTAEIRALQDTGNTLRDPITGEPVLVADQCVLQTLLPDGFLHEWSDLPVDLLFSRLADAYPDLHFRLIPYRAVGTQCAMLLAVRCKCENKTVLTAFSPTPLCDGGNYNAITGGILS